MSGAQTPSEELAAQLGHLTRVRERFEASLTPEQRAMLAELEDADTNHRLWASEQLENELCRHLSPPLPVLRLLYSHLVGQTASDIGRCCRSPEEVDAEHDRAVGGQS